jgi:Fe-S-cluster-containing hydrogenase component 2
MDSSNSSWFAMLGPLFTWKFILLVVIVILSIFVFRAFCRFICPLGAIYSLFSRIALLGVKVDKSNCTDCGLCIETCKMDVRKVGDHECIQCGACIAVCPAKAITWKGSKLFVRDNDADAPASTEIKPLAGLLKKSTEAAQAENVESANPTESTTETEAQNEE